MGYEGVYCLSSPYSYKRYLLFSSTVRIVTSGASLSPSLRLPFAWLSGALTVAWELFCKTHPCASVKRCRCWVLELMRRISRLDWNDWMDAGVAVCRGRLRRRGGAEYTRIFMAFMVNSGSMVLLLLCGLDTLIGIRYGGLHQMSWTPNPVHRAQKSHLTTPYTVP